MDVCLCFPLVTETRPRPSCCETSIPRNAFSNSLLNTMLENCFFNIYESGLDTDRKDFKSVSHYAGPPSLSLSSYSSPILRPKRLSCSSISRSSSNTFASSELALNIEKWSHPLRPSVTIWWERDCHNSTPFPARILAKEAIFLQRTSTFSRFWGIPPPKHFQSVAPVEIVR